MPAVRTLSLPSSKRVANVGGFVLSATMTSPPGPHLAWCPHSTNPLDFTDSCIRDAWSSIGPAAIVALFLLGALVPLPEFIRRPFRQFLSIEEAEALEGDFNVRDSPAPAKSFWRTALFTSVGVLQSLVWLALASFHFYTDSQRDYVRRGLFFLLISFTWLYTALLPAFKSSARPPYKLLVVYTALLLGGLMKAAGALYHSHLSQWDWIAIWLNIGSVLVVMIGLMSMPMNVPSEKVKDAIVGSHGIRVI